MDKETYLRQLDEHARGVAHLWEPKRERPRLGETSFAQAMGRLHKFLVETGGLEAVQQGDDRPTGPLAPPPRKIPIEGLAAVGVPEATPPAPPPEPVAKKKGGVKGVFDE